MSKFHPGSAVVFKAPDGPRLAAVVGGPWEDGTYDLHCQQRVRPQQMTEFPDGEVVEYHSTSMNAWIPARLLREGSGMATFDLDCKEGVEIRRIRLPQGGGVASSAAPPGTNFLGGAPHRAERLQAGDLCFYKSSAHGWIPAKVLNMPSDSICDLDVKPGASVENVFKLAEGTVVEYHSASQNSWIPAKLLKAAAEPGVFDLDCKMGVPVAKIRPPEGGPGQYQSAPLQPQPKTRADRSTGGARDATMGLFDAAASMVGYRGGKGSEAMGGYGGYGGPHDSEAPVPGTFIPGKAGGTTPHVPMPDQEPFAPGWRHGESKAPGTNLPQNAPGTNLPARPSWQAAKAQLWRYIPADGRHIDIRQEPQIDGPRSKNHLAAGDVFCVNQEFQGVQGVLFLELADGRGWVFDHKPGFGPMCERYDAEEEDSSGYYTIIHDKVSVTGARARGGEGDVVAKLGAGASVKVSEVATLTDQHRVRGRIEKPAGWVTLMDTESGRRCAIKTKKPAGGALDTGVLQNHQSCFGIWGGGGQSKPSWSTK